MNQVSAEKPWLKHVPKGNPLEVDIPEISVNQLLARSVEKYPDHTAVSFYNHTLSYAQLYGAVNRVASALVQKGIEKGDRVALMLPNCPQYPISYYAVLACGGIVVQINPMYKAQELLHVLRDSGAKLLIAYEPLLPTVEEIKDKTDLTEVITVSFSQGKGTFQTLLEDRGYQIPTVAINPREDVAVLQYTGGTTGRSKGAMLTHYNLVANAMQCIGTAEIQIEYGRERTLTVAPLFHVYGMTCGMNLTFAVGGNMILLPRFDVEEVLETIEKWRPTGFPGVPTMYIGLLQHPRFKEVDMTCFKTCSSGSAPLPIEVLNKVKAETGAPIAEGYGLSEASPVTHRNPVRGLQKPGSIGIPLPNTDAKIVDMATGEQELPPGEVGELIIKGPQVMKGYWNMPEETAHTLRNGWLYTGDLAKMDEDGFFYIVGRKKELILAGGYNVYPVEVEDVIYSHPAVLEAAVIGVPDAYRGETVKAVVVLREGATLETEELIAYCRERLANYKVPRLVEFRSELPKSAVGKILKRKLKEEQSNLSSPANDPAQKGDA
ncbi:AMP-dependent synthetase and ligase [Caldalkalibacillus thermarum TA2.A1]|uniref:AMP-dependent synthetase and ligase n=1 Tax=Caldalkalibacillus thermarum (strain TA2.A1) TaxID=986075 RepID=F5L6H9_CALTT|nr:long-chain fatty acid--CoA ligase [Caldalkalibacillus thermarum]EGL83040.1 AMP-dependent synthetase and ligase [Caldalkalibacillus thermarum TA2.A1]QZT33567.1 long-chain fatty acid--CoA ligase [Caldalkalibacillus thermarum TA2.A1]